MLARLGVEMLGAKPDAIAKAEDRALFKAAMEKVGLECPRAGVAHSIADAWKVVETTGFPAILRPSFTLGGTRRRHRVHARRARERRSRWALSQSPTHEVLIEESVLGWKEYELEVIRDRKDNFIVVCSIENLDPMGVHTGDSITVAPAMTLTDSEYQRLRDAARAVMTEIGVETGGSNVQFAVRPKDGRVLVIEMNPRVSRARARSRRRRPATRSRRSPRSSPSATRSTSSRTTSPGRAPRSSPPSTTSSSKWPRFAFEKFPGADATLGTQMKSVGEAMSIGRTFCESIQKAARSLETGRDGLASLADRVDYRALAEPKRRRDLVMEAPDFETPKNLPPASAEETRRALEALVATPSADRLFYVRRRDAHRDDRRGAPPPHGDRPVVLRAASSNRRGRVAHLGRRARRRGDARVQAARLLRPADRQALRPKRGRRPRAARKRAGIAPVYAQVDTCAAEFPAQTLICILHTSRRPRARKTDKKKVVILGGGPNRIGQGIEFDYCCVHAVQALRELGYETIMVNCNPETVSTDYDTSDRLYFEPLTLEDVLAICDEEKPEGVIVQFGGQTPLKLAVPLEKRGVKLLGTSADAIDRAEDRERFDQLLTKLALKRPRSGIAKTPDEAAVIAERIGYPVLVRPSYVLGGRAMMIAYTRTELDAYVQVAVEVARDSGAPTILVDEFLKDAIEVDVDCVCDGRHAVIGGVMQHIEEAGIHSGDSTSVLPPYSLPVEIVLSIEEQTRMLALELGVVGLMNVQFAIKGGEVYVLEVNPRASRTVPFVSKATGRPLAKIAAKLMVGRTLEELGVADAELPRHVAVKESVFPFAKFPGVDTILGPEMRSTGEVMGVADTFARAFGKALLAAGIPIEAPAPGTKKRAFISVKDEDKPVAVNIARRLRALGFEICATRGTAAALGRARIPAIAINKVNEGTPHVVDEIRGGTIGLVVNTTIGAKEVRDSYSLRRQTLLSNVPYFTTIAAALAACDAIEATRGDDRVHVRSLQEWAT